MKPSIFIDLDGTILDVKKRHQIVNRLVCDELKIKVVDDIEYWQKKREHQFQTELSSGEMINKYLEIFKAKCEQLELLKHDVVFEQMYSLLNKAKRHYTLVLSTKRHSKENLISQLDSLKLSKYFTSILDIFDTKPKAIEALGFESNDWVIGDTEEDIKTAQILNIKSIAVTWGLRSRSYLLSYNPNYCVDQSEKILTILNLSN